MEQHAINQRLNFIAEKLADSTRAFGLAIGDNSSNTHKYIKGTTRPSPEYLEKVLLRFRDIDARWLLTGEGEPFTLFVESEGDIQIQSQNQKKNRGHIINHTGNGPTTYTLEDCQRERDILRTTCDAQEREIAQLKSQLGDKERTIQILLKQQP